MNEAITQQAAFIRDYGVKLCNCSPLGSLHEPHCLGARHIEVAETLESLATRPIPSTEAEGLAGELAKLVDAAIREADDIRYYSGGSKRNASKEALAEKVILAWSIIERALRNSPSPDREGVERLRGFANGKGPTLAPYIDHNGFDQHDRLRADVRTALANTPQAEDVDDCDAMDIAELGEFVEAHRSGPTEAGELLGWAKSRAWYHYGIAWHHLERNSQDEILAEVAHVVAALSGVQDTTKGEG